jgi:hypothetical protein
MKPYLIGRRMGAEEFRNPWFTQDMGNTFGSGQKFYCPHSPAYLLVT